MGIKIVCQNKKAGFDYFIEERFEAGLVLLGPEVKSLRMGKANLVDSYAKVRQGEMYLFNMHISPYPFTSYMELDPVRPRKLLLHKQQIKRLVGKTEERGYTLIPTKVYFSDGRAKVELALAKGKHKYDKRQSLKEKDLRREMDEAHKYGRG